MSKTLISVLVLVVVIVGGYFIISSNKGGYTAPALNTETATQVQTAQTDNLPAQAGKKIAFSEFVKQGGSYKCDVKQALSDFPNSGTVYIDGAKIRGEFSTIAEGRTIKASLILRDGYSYTWIADMPNTAYKIKVGATDVNVDISGPKWEDQIGDYNCVVWTADEVMFALPTNITFKTQ